jgi:flagellar assembly protein FliH
MSDNGYQPVPFSALMQRGHGFVATAIRSALSHVSHVEDDPYARGLADGQTIAAAAFEPERAALQALVADALRSGAGNADELAALIGETVFRLVEHIAGAVPTDRIILEQQITEASALIGEADAARHIRLHPDDHALLADAGLNIELRPDPAMPRGTICVEGSDGWVEHGRALGLARLRELLDQGARP